MREKHETVALLYHATGTGKTVTSVSDASKIFVPKQNTLIVDTFMEYVSTKRTVIFCASVKHTEQIAEMIRERGVSAVAVSGCMKVSERKEYLAKFQNGSIMALCECDLFNEGGLSGNRSAVHARPTMSKVLYTSSTAEGCGLVRAKIWATPHNYFHLIAPRIFRQIVQIGCRNT